MKIDKIEEFLNKLCDDDSLKNIINIFLSAVNDWPSTIISLEEYELEVSKFIGGTVTKSEIQYRLKTIYFSKNSWQVESLSIILDVFEFYKYDTTLKEIIDDLQTTISKSA